MLEERLGGREGVVWTDGSGDLGTGSGTHHRGDEGGAARRTCRWRECRHLEGSERVWAPTAKSERWVGRLPRRACRSLCSAASTPLERIPPPWTIALSGVLSPAHLTGAAGRVGSRRKGWHLHKQQGVRRECTRFQSASAHCSFSRATCLEETCSLRHFHHYRTLPPART